MALIAEALKTVAAQRPGFRVVHFSVQGNHIHLIVEATDRRTLSLALRALQIRIARGLNVIMRTAGRRFDDRYHEHVLKTPTETRNALLYVVGNHAVHLARSGRTPRHDVDPFSSVACGDGLIRPPASWLVREGWLPAPPT